jgi:hypothetical protein
MASDRFSPLRGMVPPDPDSEVSRPEWAVVYVPRRRRNRFAASCVETFATAEQAIAAADPDRKRFAARVTGPSKSSEGQYVYYLVRWLD